MSSISQRPIKLRRYIAQRLADYYAQPSNAVVGAASNQVDFQSLWGGEWHWKRVYRKLYDDDQQGQWLTPVELFRPYYSQALAEYCIQQQLSAGQNNEEFEIVELGGGRGTNASGILTHLQQQHPDAYERLSSYTIVDSSPTLHELQKDLLLGNGNSEDENHASKLQFVLKDLTDVAESKTELLTPSKTPTILLALELLDNLGHDKVRRDALTRKLEHAVVTSSKGTMAESFQPLQKDPLLKKILLKLPSYGGTMGHPVWIPSVACGVLMEIAKARPNATVILADFDYLPPPDLLGEETPLEEDRMSAMAAGEPLVTDMDGIDYECYLNSPHLADILYPTDFRKLSRFCTNIFGDEANVKVTKQGNFLRTVGPEQVKATTSRLMGYSPMVDDFYNCSVLTVSQGGDSDSEKGGEKEQTKQ